MSCVVGQNDGPHVGRGVAGELLDVLLELPLLVAPGVVGVGLLEADLAERVHHRRLGERLGQPDHVGVVAAHVGDQPLPELDRLGVRVVDAEDLDPVVDPHLDDPAHLGVGPGRVVVEVERVDVLVLLRRVLGVGDRAVGAGGEPLRVGRHVGVVGGALQGDVDRDLEAELLRPGRRRSRSRRSRRGRGGWRRGRRRASRWRRGCPGRLVRRRGCCSVPCGWSCRSGGSASGRRRRSPSAAIAGSRSAAVRSVPDGPHPGLRVLHGALGAREDLVPRAIQGALALHEQRVCRGRAHVVAQRAGGELGPHRGVGAGVQPGQRRAAGVAQRRDRVGEDGLLLLGARRPRRGRARACGRPPRASARRRRRRRP